MGFRLSVPAAMFVLAGAVGAHALASEPSDSTLSGSSTCPCHNRGDDRVAQTDSATAWISNWNTLVTSHATADGGFRYEALMASADDTAALAAIVGAIGSADVGALSPIEKLAFYINAYNALAVASVVELWPVDGVLSEDGFFDSRTHLVAGATVTLNQLEGDYIRSAGDPRVHFVVNCASAGCPRLHNEAYTAANLEGLLGALTDEYVQATTRVDREGQRIEVSQIFEWYAGDFGGADGVREFVASHLDADTAAFVRDTATTIAFFPYDWALNGR
jgi:hypothetical protein